MKSPELTGPIKRILVINVARIGDTILAVPVFRALRAAYPQAEIVCLAHPKRVEVLQGLPQIDRSAPITKRSAPFMGWLGKGYDLALVFGHEPALLAYALRAARQVVALPTGNPAIDARLFAAVPDKGILHAVDDRLRWLEALGIPATSRRLDYRVTDAERQARKAGLPIIAVNAAHGLVFRLPVFRPRPIETGHSKISRPWASA